MGDNDRNDRMKYRMKLNNNSRKGRFKGFIA